MKVIRPFKKHIFIQSLKVKPIPSLSISDPVDVEIPEIKYRISIKLKRDDLKCLGNFQWLSDIVIDAYLKFIINNSRKRIGTTNTFFGKILNKKEVNNNRLKEWEGISKFLNGEFEHFFIPIATRAHWVLFDVLYEENTIRVYDSLARKNDALGKKLLKFINEETKKVFKLESVKCGHQENSFDCGVFILAFAKAISLDRDVKTINQKEISEFRKTIRSDLNQVLTAYSS